MTGRERNHAAGLRPRLSAQFRAAAALLIAAAAIMFVVIARSATGERDVELVDDQLLRSESLQTSIHKFAETGRQDDRGEVEAELAELRRAADKLPGWGQWVSELAPLIERRLSAGDGVPAPDLRRLEAEIDRRVDALQEDAVAIQLERRHLSHERALGIGALFAVIVLLSLLLLRAAFKTLAEEMAAHRDTAEKLLRAEQRERRRLSQILHDHLQQTLAAAAMHINLVLRRETDNDARENAAAAAGILKEAVQTTRVLSYELCPPDIARQSLGRSLQWLGDEMRRRHKLEVAVVIEHDPPTIPDPIRDFCLGATRELLFNVVKHSKTTAARLAVSSSGGRLRVEVSDAGEGFDPSWPREQEGSLGLADISERINLFGGRLEIDSRPRHGCRVALVMPVPG